MRIIHFADVHLGMENYGKLDAETGLNSRLGDFLKSFDFLAQTAIKERVDLVCFSGDAYKTREPSPTYQKAFASRIYEIAKNDIPVVLLIGNHDIPNALGKANTLEIYPTLNIANVHLIGDEVKTIQSKSGPIQVAGLPWFTKQQLLSKDELKLPLEKIFQLLSSSLAKKIEYLSSKVDQKIPSILLAHATVEGATFGSERSVMIGSDIIVPLAALKQTRFNYVGLGHLHKYQVLSENPPIIYSGSIERIDFGEEKEDKGFVIINIDNVNSKLLTDWKFIKTPARRFQTINIKISANEIDLNEKISSIIEKYNINEAVVKVIIDVPEEKVAEISEAKIREALKKANFIAGIIKETKSNERAKTINGYSDELTSLDTLGILEKFLKNKKVSPAHQKELLNAAEAIIEEIS